MAGHARSPQLLEEGRTPLGLREQVCRLGLVVSERGVRELLADLELLSLLLALLLILNALRQRLREGVGEGRGRAAQVLPPFIDKRAESAAACPIADPAAVSRCAEIWLRFEKALSAALVLADAADGATPNPICNA